MSRAKTNKLNAMDHIVLLLVCVSPVALCYSSGQVKDSCEDMQPHHSGLSPQTEPAPFTVTTDHSSYRLGDEVKVQLQAPASTPFIGFLLQAREVGRQSPVGSFSVIVGTTQHLSCNQRPNIISSADCSITKVCFSQPSNCDPAVSADCYFMSAMMSPSDAAVHYELTGPSDGYISFGFSDDQMMGNDDIYICSIGSDSLVQLQYAFSTGRTAPHALPLVSKFFRYLSFISRQSVLCGFNLTLAMILPVHQGYVSDVRASVQDRVISCSFTSMNPISTHRGTSGFNKTYHLMFAHGSSNNGQIQFHTATFISSEKVDISRPQLIRKTGRPHVIKAHGALMLVAWMTMGSLGMMVARYLKRLAKGQSLWGKDVWFLVHVAVMSVTIATTIIAVILSFSFIKLYSYLEQVQENVLYMDTDSLIYVVKEGDTPLKLGNYLGDLTDELDGDTIQEFAAAGPKSYAYQTKQKKKVVLRVKGITQTKECCEQVNFDTVRELVEGYLEGSRGGVIETPHHNIRRDKKTFLLKNCSFQKQFRVVYDKRRLFSDGRRRRRETNRQTD
ncbi:Ferric-chelate reductase 1 [Nibea albiflora]|uniref:Ferric-chelate reductase 1 n=1 Tax=Nibea albiflora TaxID=240163 RepID=A0ACB7F433_NIBAL|nr:Ferric-chelate reductase 1 [Nibea albiflora]